MCFKIL